MPWRTLLSCFTAPCARDSLRNLQTAGYRGPKSTWFQSLGIPAALTGEPPPTRKPARTPDATNLALTATTGVGVVHRSAPVAGQATCVLTSHGAAGSPWARNAICSSHVRAPEIIIRPRSPASIVIRTSPLASSSEIPQRAARSQGSVSGRIGAGITGAVGLRVGPCGKEGCT